MHGIAALMEQNKRIEHLCLDVEDGDLSVVGRLFTEWQVHERLDHDYVYRCLPSDVGERSVFVARAQADQRLISRLMRRLSNEEPDVADYANRSGLVVRLIRQHVLAEELTVLPLLMFDQTSSLERGLTRVQERDRSGWRDRL